MSGSSRSPRPSAGALLALLVLPLLAGCGATATSYVHPSVNFGFLERAAVLPFRNLSADVLADERMQSIFLMEILKEDALVIVDPRETVAAMLAIGIAPGSELSPQQSVALGKELGVDALFFGVVEEYGYAHGDRRRGPEITGVFGMTETETGADIWRAQVHETGSSIWKRLFGGSPDDLYTVSQEAVRNALRTLL